MINNAVFFGAPTSNISQSAYPVNSGLDASNGLLYYTALGGRNRMTGWYPINGVVGYSLNIATISNVANVLTYLVPFTAMYSLFIYESSTNNASGGTLPNVTVTYTDADTGLSITLTPVTTMSAVGKGIVNTGAVTIRALAGTNIVVATTGYVAGSPIPLAYTVQANVSYRG